MNTPNIYTLAALTQTSQRNSVKLRGLWVPARPLGYTGIGRRFKAAWLVFTGRADAVVWPCGQ